MSEASKALFERLSGWSRTPTFERNREGVVTIERDVRSGHDQAFFWSDWGDRHAAYPVASMFFCGDTYVKEGP